jgi:hypothetical protein
VRRSQRHLSRLGDLQLALLAATLGAVVVLGGCGGAPHPAVRVAVLPVETLGGTDGPAVRAALESSLARELPGAAVAAGTVDAALAAEAPASGPASQPVCAAEPTCARRLGRRLGAGHVLAVTVASLARTHVLRARLVSTDQTVAEREVSETIVGGHDALSAAVSRLPLRLFPPPPPRWYARWWVWAGVAAVVAAATTTAVVLTRGSGRHADVVVPLP